ncbi:MAG TPA: LuxR C-terminal-related transcriptional regulator [Bryobacteraceae bacterium]|jgi:PAS domain S-box-containing protein|nr:LuxR C-terminal-related transcriptional regulator [Bryobacteraceae bacterium]
MSPSKETDEVSKLREKLAELEAELQRQARQRQMSEARFYLLADAAPWMIWMSGPDAMCTYFNRAWLEFRGRALAEEAGNGWADGLHPDDRAFCIENYLRAFGAREPFRIQYRLQRADGDYRWLEDTGLPRFDADGSFVGFMGSAVDVHDRKCGIFTPDEESVRLVFALTERERQVLVLIADGKSTKEAAVKLGISYKTADSHRSRILEKLGVHETASMVRYAIRAGLITP